MPIPTRSRSSLADSWATHSSNPSFSLRFLATEAKVQIVNGLQF